MNPWLSVLIPTYNGENYLPYALDSIVKQEDPNIECIIIDDGSTDATLSIISSYQKKLKINLLHRERQGNWVTNTNSALAIARGEYVCFLHQDDIWYKNRLSVMKRIIDQFPEIGFFLHASNFIAHNGRYLGKWRCPLPSFPEIISSKIMIEKLLIQNFISIPAPIFKREIAVNVGGLKDILWYTADWDFWLKMASCSKTLYYPHPLSGFRIQPSSQTVLRSSHLDDFRNQLERVVQTNLSLWSGPETVKKRLFIIAIFSVQVNTALASIFHGNKIDLAELIRTFFLLGPSGWLSYFRNSRVWERSYARVRARLLAKL